MNARRALTVLFLSLLLALPMYARSPQQGSAARVPQEDPTSLSPEENPTARNCIVRVEPVEPETQKSRISGLDCYATSSEAIYAATDGAVSLPPDTPFKEQLRAFRSELNSVANKSSTGSGSVTLAVDYVDSIYRGDFLIYQGSTTCSSTVSYQFPTLTFPPYFDFNDIFSSSQAFGGCNRNIHYEHSNYGGTYLICTPNCTGFGALNDKTSSRRLQSTCGEASCVGPDGNYISHYTGSNCDGTEYYYLPYDSFGYQCRPDLSAGVLCGTTHNSVTTYSYRYGGWCYANAWPSGNPLNDLVRVYR